MTNNGQKITKNWKTEQEAKRAYMAANGMYSETDEHSSCGVGMVVSIDGSRSRQVVENGIKALRAVWHRGAVDADGKTGDGAVELFPYLDALFVSMSALLTTLLVATLGKGIFRLIPI